MQIGFALINPDRDQWEEDKGSLGKHKVSLGQYRSHFRVQVWFIHFISHYATASSFSNTAIA